eukprot:TRINITY_DN7546_c0_g1_i2.p1 TRINITY_DN7546_c0_g1~~TRINITY_DN7546_c0_g1_i2.p1  ORF type:complete len:221 (-),score=43.47 TRINITY_DN7546_c0_g1_i2:93-755(-)
MNFTFTLPYSNITVWSIKMYPNAASTWSNMTGIGCSSAYVTHFNSQKGSNNVLIVSDDWIDFTFNSMGVFVATDVTPFQIQACYNDLNGVNTCVDVCPDDCNGNGFCDVGLGSCKCSGDYTGNNCVLECGKDCQSFLKRVFGSIIVGLLVVCLIPVVVLALAIGGCVWCCRRRHHHHHSYTHVQSTIPYQATPYQQQPTTYQQGTPYQQQPPSYQQTPKV